jgi:hypothetical protein
VLDDVIPLSTLNLTLQPLIPGTSLDLIEFVPGAVVPPLVFLDLNGRMFSVSRIQFSDELRYQMRVSARFLNGRQARTGRLPLSRS